MEQVIRKVCSRQRMPDYLLIQCILLVSSHSSSITLLLSCYMQSHKDEVHALAVHPNETQFISASLDHCVSLWDAETHQVIWTIDVEVSILVLTVMEWINV